MNACQVPADRDLINGGNSVVIAHAQTKSSGMALTDENWLRRNRTDTAICWPMVQQFDLVKQATSACSPSHKNVSTISFFRQLVGSIRASSLQTGRL